MEKRIISFDIKADFGFLKKPDINEGIYLTYNCLHKPALLGILGAINGLGGHYQSYIKKSQLEYYEKLGNIKVGIQPLNSLNGNFTKTVITYNNSVGYANEDGGTLIITEQTLIKPAYRIYLLLDLEIENEKKLFSYLQNEEAEFIPYLGKNDFQLWWNKNEIKDYGFPVVAKPTENYTIENLFIKPEGKTIRNNAERVSDMVFDWSEPNNFNFFIFFENLPVGFDIKTTNYCYDKFVFTNKKLTPKFIPEHLYFLESENAYIQLN